MVLFHFSEESDIDVFVPRVKANRQELPPVVWAIDEAHEYTFYFPRDCPRIVYGRTENLSEADERTFFGASGADRIIVVETGWYERIQHTTLYRYRLPSATFELFDTTAGYYISRETVKPVEMEPLDQLLDRLMGLNMEVRFTPNLHPLRDAILRSGLTEFGIHRFMNARTV